MTISISKCPLRAAAEAFLADISADKSSSDLLVHFSLLNDTLVQHDHIHNLKPVPFLGLNAIRSYFDLLHIYFVRDDMWLHEFTVLKEESKVVVKASVRWTWRMSKRSWIEDFSCEIILDPGYKVKELRVQTSSPRTTCALYATDTPPVASL